MSPEEFHTVRVPGTLSNFLSRLDEEYNKSLQRISPHSIDYVMRLRDEVKLVDLLTVVQRYYSRVSSPADAAMLAELRVEHLYYRHDTIMMQVAKATEAEAAAAEAKSKRDDAVADGDGATPTTVPEDSAAKVTKQVPVDMAEKMADLCKDIYQHGTDRQRTRAMLCHIYHHAIHDRFLEARDLLLMSHLQETIPVRFFWFRLITRCLIKPNFSLLLISHQVTGDISTMILFNRTMVTLGKFTLVDSILVALPILESASFTPCHPYLQAWLPFAWARSGTPTNASLTFAPGECASSWPRVSPPEDSATRPWNKKRPRRGVRFHTISTSTLTCLKHAISLVP